MANFNRLMNFVCRFFSVSGVRLRGQQLQQYDQWQKPEVRSNLGEDLTLNDPIKRDNREIDSERQQRALQWQRAHSE